MNTSWTDTGRIASHWRPDPASPGRVRCELCPRHCRPRDGEVGFCKVRGPVDGSMRALSYGRSVTATEEVIETEAVNHYRPGARNLSLGNVGCMMSCSFCQNWETSQVEHLDPRVPRRYTPEQIVELCLTHDIGIISWTYNDPVVWHEFVVDTSRLARAHGIATLYKSAFYIESRPVEELIDCIDVFSLSLKSMSEDFYRRITLGRLPPVLERIQQVARSGRHLELSQLVIPELNDDDADLERTIQWVGEHLGSEVPLHFVAFHPAYRYQSVDRTPVATLMRARELALAAGIEHCYLGNVYRPECNDSLCRGCGATLVSRFGLTAEIRHLGADGRCTGCDRLSAIIEAHGGRQRHPVQLSSAVPERLTHLWQGEVHSAHISRVVEGSMARSAITVTPIGDGVPMTRRLGGGLDRLIVSRQGPGDRGFRLSWADDAQFAVLPVLDRAHFPVLTRTAAEPGLEVQA